MTLDLRAWALHDAVFRLARESGLESFHVECRQGPEGETVIALVLEGASSGQRDRSSGQRPRAPARNRS